MSATHQRIHKDQLSGNILAPDLDIYRNWQQEESMLSIHGLSDSVFSESCVEMDSKKKTLLNKVHWLLRGFETRGQIQHPFVALMAL